MTRDPYASLKHGLVGAWIPSISGSGLLLPDLSMRGNNGVLTNMDASDWVGSGTGKALDFDGSNDYVNVLDATPLNLTTTATVSCWVYARANLYQFIQSKRSGAADPPYAIARYTNNNAFFLVTNSSVNYKTVFSSSNSVPIDLWTHVVGTFNGSADVQVYINGKLDTASTDSGGSAFSAMQTTATPLIFGRYETQSTNLSFDGAIDDVRIYSRVLSTAEIKLLASDRGIGFKPNKKLSRFSTRYTYQPPKAKVFEGVRVRDHDYASLRQGLVGAWCPSLPNGGSGNILPDQSGRGNHGTLTNMGPEDWVSSGSGRALDFDGVDDYIPIGTGVPLAGKSITCSAWIYRATLGNVYPLMQYNTSLGANARGFYFGASNWTANGQITFVSGTSTTDYLAASGPQFVAAQWNHIGFVVFFDGASSTIKMFLNGMEVSTTDRSAGTKPSTFPISTLVPFEIQSGIGGSALRFYGNSCQIDDIRVYSRALTEAEIRLLASKRGIGLQPSPTKFIAKEKKTGLRRRILTGQT